MPIIDHKHQTEHGKDREEYWVHMIIDMLKSEFPSYFKNRKPIITKTENLLELKGLNIEGGIITQREIKVNDKLYRYEIRLRG